MADYAAATPESADLALCLGFNASPGDIAALRLRLLQGGWAPVLQLAAELRLLPALAANAAAKGLAAGIPMRRGTQRQASVSTVLADATDEHVQRSAVLKQRLGEILDTLAAHDLRPLMLKGARPLWLGAPQWRTLRDIDLLLPAPATAEAVRIMCAAGYRLNDHFAGPAGWHHGAELYRDDLPGWVEVHARAGVRRIEAILPTPWLVANAEETATEGQTQTALTLPASLQILHCLAHHHVGHRGDYYGEIEFKGLYEFAGDVAALSEAGRQELLRAARSHPRLVAMLDLWLAAAADVFRLQVEAPLRVTPDAQFYWRQLSAGVVLRAATGRRPWRFEGLGAETMLSTNAPRLRALPGGRTALGRLGLRARALRSLITRAALKSDEEH